MRPSECVYTYTGSVTDRQFVLQWACPPEGETKANGCILIRNSNIKGPQMRNVFDWRDAGRGGRENQTSTIPPAGFILDYDEEPKTAQARREVSDSFSPPASPHHPSLYRLTFFAWSAEAFGNEMGFFYGNCTGVSPGSGSFFGEHLELIKLQ